MIGLVEIPNCPPIVEFVTVLDTKVRYIGTYRTVCTALGLWWRVKVDLWCADLNVSHVISKAVIDQRRPLSVSGAAFSEILLFFSSPFESDGRAGCRHPPFSAHSDETRHSCIPFAARNLPGIFHLNKADRSTKMQN
jgi:hypothetical protein